MGTIKLMDSEQELNRRRAEWVGINLVGVPEGCEPNFTQSLDACFKWLVPKLDKLNITCGLVAYCDRDNEGEKPYYAWLCCIDKPYNTQFAWAETPALALCKAIDKLIDSEKKDEGNKNETH